MRDSVLVSALAASWLADRPHGIYDEAVERLLDVRDCIHLVAGKDTNLMLTPYQAKVAAMLGLADPTWPENRRAAYSIDDLQTLLARIGRRISFSLDSTASRAEHSLTHEKPRFAFFQMFSQRSGGKREAPQFDVVAPGVAKHEGGWCWRPVPSLPRMPSWRCVWPWRPANSVFPSTRLPWLI